MKQHGHFSGKNEHVFAGLEYVRAYINNLLVIRKCSFKDYLEKLKQVIYELKASGL